MTLAIINQVLSQEFMHGVLSLNSDGQLVVQDQVKAMNIMLTTDANSQVYKIVQLAMQIQTLRDQSLLKENNEQLQKLIAAGKIKILELETALKESHDRIFNLETEIQDDQTRKKIHEYELNQNANAVNNGIADIALGIVLTPLIVTTLAGIVLIGRGIIRLDEKPRSVVLLEDKMERYRAFHPEASLTEVFNYSKENPGKFSKMDAERFTNVEQYRLDHPEASLEDYEKYIEEKIEFRKQLEAHLNPPSRRRRHPRF